MSTAGATGTPRSALIGIAVTSKLEIIFDTAPSTRKYPNSSSDGTAPKRFGVKGKRKS